MKERLLISGGCSYTDKNFKTNAPDFKMPEKTWPMWPEHLAKKLGLKDINVGGSGYDNFTIYETVLRSILSNEGKVDTVVVLWSGWDRNPLFNTFYLVTLNAFYTNIKKRDEWSNPQWMKDIGFDETILKYLNSNWWNPYNFIKKSVNYSLSLMYTLATICESKGIKYIFYQGVIPIEYGGMNLIENVIERPLYVKYNIDEFFIFNEIKRRPYSGKLEERKNNIIGWPFLPSIGGHYTDYLRYMPDVLRHKQPSYFDSPMDLSGMDKHPNAEAQTIIADIFYDRWKKVYG